MIVERTKNTIKNGIWGLLNKIVLMIFPFITRTCIIYLLGIKYTGLNNLFTSILSILSLAELGFGNAIIYSMYRPIANGDEEKICALMNLYRKVYTAIGGIVLGIGLILVPFIPYFIKDSVPSDINIYVLYAIFLSESVLSYWLFAYKNCLLNAFQKNYIASNVSTILNLITNILQLIFLFTTKNYYLFIIWKPICIVLINIVTAHFVDKKFPQYKCRGKVEKEEIKRIKKQVIGLMAQRLAFSSRNSFDSIVISAYLGLSIVGIYNNYFYLLTALTLILSLVFSSMQGGIGNSIAIETEEKNYSDFRKINFGYMCISGWCSVCLAVLFQAFMELWVGKELMFPTYIALLFAFYFYTLKMTDSEGAYIAGTGIWWRCKFTYLIEAGVNLVLNLVLGYYWGVVGVMLASIISVIFVNYIANGIILFKYYFASYSFITLALDDLFILIVSIIATFLVGMVTNALPNGDTKRQLFILFLEKGILCVVVCSVVMLIMLSINKQFRTSFRWLVSKVFKKNNI